MTLREIQIKAISELPKHQRETLKTKLGEHVFSQYAEVDALVEIELASSIPHIKKIEPFSGTFSDRLLNNVNGGTKVEDLFKY